MLDKLILRLTLAGQAILGKLDGVVELAREIDRLKGVEGALRKAVDIEVRQQKYWYELWRATGAGHHRAQSIMVDEIDRLIQIASALMKLVPEESRKNYQAMLSKYRDGKSWIDQLEQYKETFLETKHPEDIRVPPSSDSSKNLQS